MTSTTHLRWGLYKFCLSFTEIHCRAWAVLCFRIPRALHMWLKCHCLLCRWDSGKEPGLNISIWMLAWLEGMTLITVDIGTGYILIPQQIVVSWRQVASEILWPESISGNLDVGPWGLPVSLLERTSEGAEQGWAEGMLRFCVSRFALLVLLSCKCSRLINAMGS